MPITTQLSGGRASLDPRSSPGSGSSALCAPCCSFKSLPLHELEIQCNTHYLQISYLQTHRICNPKINTRSTFTIIHGHAHRATKSLRHLTCMFSAKVKQRKLPSASLLQLFYYKQMSFRCPISFHFFIFLCFLLVISLFKVA